MTRHRAHCVKTLRHSQKSIVHDNTVGGGPSHGHSQHAQRFGVVSEICESTYRLITVLGTRPGDGVMATWDGWCIIQDCRRSLSDVEQREVAIMANGHKLKEEITNNLVLLPLSLSLNSL